MRHGVESQGLLEQLSIKLQELAGISGAGIGDDKADVEIVSGGGESPDEILPRDIKHDDSMLHTVTLAELNAYFVIQDGSVARADRPQRHAFPDRKMYRASETGFSGCHGTHAAWRRGRRGMAEPGFTKTTAGSPSAVTRERPGRLSTEDCLLPITLSSRSPCWVIQR